MSSQPTSYWLLSNIISSSSLDCHNSTSYFWSTLKFFNTGTLLWLLMIPQRPIIFLFIFWLFCDNFLSVPIPKSFLFLFPKCLWWVVLVEVWDRRICLSAWKSVPDGNIWPARCAQLLHPSSGFAQLPSFGQIPVDVVQCQTSGGSSNAADVCFCNLLKLSTILSALERYYLVEALK